MTVAWRAQDEALLTRLEDEALFESVWASLVPEGTPAPRGRVAGVLAALRGTPEGAEAVERAGGGQLMPLLRAMTQPDVETLSPRLAHHLALMWASVARAIGGADEVAIVGARKAHLNSIVMWLWLAEEGEYLIHLAEAVIGGALPRREIDAAARDIALEPLRELGEQARGGARELSPAASVALSVLASVDKACARAGCSDAIRERALGRAQKERSRAIDEAAARVEECLEEALVHGAEPDELIPLLSDGVAVWRWSGCDVLVERGLVRQITARIWDFYRDKRWDDIRAVLRPLEAPVESLARRIEGDPTQIAYAAPCAQMIVFAAEVARTFDEQFVLAERAIRLCPTHRNGRLVLSDLLVERGLSRLDKALPWQSGDALREAEADIRRAMDLYPQLKRLDAAKRRLEKLGVVWS